MSLCASCGHDTPDPLQPEPPVGTWVKDRFGAVHVHNADGWAGAPGFYGFGRWRPMWEARGPLVECGPWGAPVEEGETP